MAKVVASRAPRDEAFQERLERAAARFSSIHDRWSGTSEQDLASPPSAALAAAAEDAAGPAESQRELALPVSESGVCVTPILGIAEDTDDEPRPRFKTLMGVPRSDPDMDELAGLGPSSRPESGREPGPDQSEATRRQRPAPPPLPSRFLGLPEAAGAPAAPGPEQPSAPYRPALDTLPPQTGRTASAQWMTLPPGSAGIRPELAAARRAQRRRSWLVGIVSFAATLALFAVAAPRERTLALRWLREEYAARMLPSQPAVVDTSRALKPSVVEPAVEGNDPAPAQTASLDDPSAELQRIEEQLPPARTSAAAARVDDGSDPASDDGTPRTEVAIHQKSETQPESVSPSSAAKAELEAATPPRRATRRKSGVATQLERQVAAPRKRSTRATTAKPTTAGSPKAATGTLAKERATRQNSPRRGANGGIIRETPF